MNNENFKDNYLFVFDNLRKKINELEMINSTIGSMQISDDYPKADFDSDLEYERNEQTKIIEELSSINIFLSFISSYNMSNIVDDGINLLTNDSKIANFISQLSEESFAYEFVEFYFKCLDKCMSYNENMKKYKELCSLSPDDKEEQKRYLNLYDEENRKKADMVSILYNFHDKKLFSDLTELLEFSKEVKPKEPKKIKTKKKKDKLFSRILNTFRSGKESKEADKRSKMQDMIESLISKIKNSQINFELINFDCSECVLLIKKYLNSEFTRDVLDKVKVIDRAIDYENESFENLNLKIRELSELSDKIDYYIEIALLFQKFYDQSFDADEDKLNEFEFLNKMNEYFIANPSYNNLYSHFIKIQNNYMVKLFGNMKNPSKPSPLSYAVSSMYNDYSMWIKSVKNLDLNNLDSYMLLMYLASGFNELSLNDQSFDYDKLNEFGISIQEELKFQYTSRLGDSSKLFALLSFLPNNILSGEQLKNRIISKFSQISAKIDDFSKKTSDSDYLGLLEVYKEYLKHKYSMFNESISDSDDYQVLSEFNSRIGAIDMSVDCIFRNADIDAFRTELTEIEQDAYREMQQVGGVICPEMYDEIKNLNSNIFSYIDKINDMDVSDSLDKTK